MKLRASCGMQSVGCDQEIALGARRRRRRRRLTPSIRGSMPTQCLCRLRSRRPASACRSGRQMRDQALVTARTGSSWTTRPSPVEANAPSTRRCRSRRRPQARSGASRRTAHSRVPMPVPRSPRSPAARLEHCDVPAGVSRRWAANSPPTEPPITNARGRGKYPLRHLR